jgi:hypothetical protein
VDDGMSDKHFERMLAEYDSEQSTLEGRIGETVKGYNKSFLMINSYSLFYYGNYRRK